ncbi:MAG TPA: site-specific integrase [Sphingobium sp.]|uniref:site-specific integrase n=1 Tax=Sphingobium sp. TaxID=1912891 RepID=UPI002ED2974E
MADFLNFRPSDATQSCYTEGMSDMFKLSRRKGSAKWQVRKRWPSDVASVLKGEFVKSTGEEEKRKAQEGVSLIVAEYERRVREARDKLAATPRQELGEAEAHRMAAEFFRSSLPSFVVTRQLDPTAHRQLLKDTKERLTAVQDSLGRNDYWAVSGAARTLMTQTGIAIPSDSPSADYLRRMLMRAFVELHRAAVAHLEGNAHYTPQDAALLDVPEDGAGEERTIEKLLEAYEADKQDGWSGSTKKAVAPVFRVLRDVFPKRDVSSITREEARGVMALLQSLPANLGKRKELAGLTVPQAVAKGKTLGLTPIQPKTINDAYLLHIASIFNWARKEQWVPSNPFEGLSVHDPVADEDRRDPFTVEQLKVLFSSAPWTAPWEPGGEKPGAYWVPLLCLFHGLRNGEAAGLRVEDVGMEDGEPVIHVREYDGRRLKTKESRGTLPIHPEVLRLGFLTHVEQRRKAGEILLFPEGVANNRGQVAAKLGERFSARVKALGLIGRKLGIHSFRHNFEDRLRAAELPVRTALALARRTEVGSSRIYGDGVSARQKAAALVKIVYPGLDLGHLVPVKSETEAA